MKKSFAIASMVWLETLRRKDLYVLFILLGALLMTLVSLNIFGVGSVTGYALDVGLMLTWAFGWILAAHATSRELPREEARRTIFPLLAKPITRAELLVGKWLGAWSIVCLATLAFYMLAAGSVAAMGGAVPWLTLAQGCALHAVALAVIAAVALLVSTRMNHDAAVSVTLVLTGAAFLVVPRIPEFLVRESGLKASVLLGLYHALPHLEVFDLRQRIVHGYPPISPMVFGWIVAYGAAVTTVPLFAAWLAYRRKRFDRGAAA